jgi:tetratricopeptide (TPR) repeat protein
MNEWSELPTALRKKFAEEAARYYQSLLAEGSADPSLRYETAVGYRSLGYLYYRLKEYEPAEKFLRESIAILDPLAGQHSDHPEYRQQAGWSRLVFAWTLEETSRRQEAQTALEQAAEIYEKLIAHHPRNSEYPDELFWCYQKLIALKLPSKGVDEQELLRRARELLARISPEAFSAPTVHGKLGEFYAVNGRWDESVASFRRGLDLFKQQAPQSRVKRRQTSLEYETCLADVLIESGRPSAWREATQLLERAAADRPGDAAVLRELGLKHARLGHWAEAADALSRSVEVKPADAQSWYALATLRLMAGDVEVYRETCREMLKRFGNTSDAKIAGRIALTCSLAEGAVDDLPPLLRLAERAPADDEQHACVRGVAQYRAGRDVTAIESLNPQADRFKPWDVTGFSALAMAHQRLGHAPEAVAALANARHIDQKIGADPAKGEPLPCDWTVHLVQARILLREAEQFIAHPSTAPAGTTDKSSGTKE